MVPLQGSQRRDVDTAAPPWWEAAMRPTGPFAPVPAVALAAAAHAATPDGPRRIVAGSFADPDYAQPQDGAIRRASTAVTRGGLQPFDDVSGEFAGFTAGLDVVVVGGYADRASAERDLARLRPCVPGAYVRPGRYLGE